MHTTTLSFWINPTNMQRVELGSKCFSQKVVTPQQATLKFSKVEDTSISTTTITKTIIKKHMAFEVSSGFQERDSKQNS